MEVVEHYAKIVLATRQLGCARSFDSHELESWWPCAHSTPRTGTRAFSVLL
jgi:hypothetical protein